MLGRTGVLLGLRPGEDASNFLMNRELEKQRALTRRVKEQLASVRAETEQLATARRAREHEDATRAQAAREQRMQQQAAQQDPALVEDPRPPAGEMLREKRRRRSKVLPPTLALLQQHPPEEAHEGGGEGKQSSQPGDHNNNQASGGDGTKAAASQRWFSVARGGMAECEGWTLEQKGGDRAHKLAEIRRRKTNNVRSHVVLGDDVVEYETELHRGEKYAAGRIDLQQMKMNKVAQRERKLANTRSRPLGDFPAEYVLTSTLPDPTGNLEHYRGTLNPELAKQLRKSELTSMYSESDEARRARLVSTNQADLKNWAHLLDPVERDRTRARARQLKKELTSTSIPIADYRKQQEEEAGEDGQPKPRPAEGYSTDYRESFVYDYDTYPSAKRLPVLSSDKPKPSQLPWTYEGDKYSFVSVTASQFIDASKWNAAQVFERQRSYLRRFKDKDKGAGTQWQLGSDPDYQ